VTFWLVPLCELGSVVLVVTAVPDCLSCVSNSWIRARILSSS
jgi:hypothetical protein